MEQKAILEIDLPNSCSECPLCDIIHGTGCSYWADELDTPTDKRHNLCPLKPKRTRPVETEEEKQTKLCRARRVLSQYNRATLNRILTANGDCEYDKELYQAIEDVLGELRFRSDSHCALFVIDVGSKKRRIHRIGTDPNPAPLTQPHSLRPGKHATPISDPGRDTEDRDGGTVPRAPYPPQGGAYMRLLDPRLCSVVMGWV